MVVYQMADALQDRRQARRRDVAPTDGAEKVPTLCSQKTNVADAAALKTTLDTLQRKRVLALKSKNHGLKSLQMPRQS